MFTDSREINKIIINYLFPLPIMNDFIDFLSGERYFYKIYLKSGYHQIMIREKDEWKISFKTNEGLQKLLVMAFHLWNSSSTFMRLIK